MSGPQPELDINFPAKHKFPDKHKARNGEGHNIVRLIKALKILYINTRTNTRHTNHVCNQLNLILSQIIFMKRLLKRDLDEIIRTKGGRSFQWYLLITVRQNFLMHLV